MAACSDAASVTDCAAVNVPAAGVAVTVGGMLSMGVATLLMVTVTEVAVALLFAASLATAVSVWSPLIAARVSHVVVYGLEVSSAPRFVPSSTNCTPATPTLSVAFADTTTAAPDTVVPDCGAVIATAGTAASVLSAAVTTSNVVVPSVQINPT